MVSNSLLPSRTTRRRLALLIAGCAVVPSCLMVKTHDRDMVMSQEEFGKYVEQVFRYHNQVMNELIEASEERTEMDPGEARELSVAEEKMIDQCRPLNDVVANSLTGQSIGLVTELDLANTVPACEDASHRVEELTP